MDRIDEVVLAVDFVHVDVIIVAPFRGPWVVVDEPIAAVIKAAIVTAGDAEVVFTSEVSAEVLVANAAAVVVSAVALRLLRVVAVVALNLLRVFLALAVLFSALSFLLLLLLVRLPGSIGLFLVSFVSVTIGLFLFVLLLLFLLPFFFRGLLAIGFLFLGFLLGFVLSGFVFFLLGLLRCVGRGGHKQCKQCCADYEFHSFSPEKIAAPEQG